MKACSFTCPRCASSPSVRGRELMVRLEDTLRAQEVGKAYLLTARGSAAEAFYRACSFYTSEKIVMLGEYLKILRPSHKYPSRARSVGARFLMLPQTLPPHLESFANGVARSNPYQTFSHFASSQRAADRAQSQP